MPASACRGVFAPIGQLVVPQRLADHLQAREAMRAAGIVLRQIKRLMHQVGLTGEHAVGAHLHASAWLRGAGG